MADDLETLAKKARASLREFMDEEDIATLEKNAVEETQLALEIFPKRPDEFYTQVMHQAELDRYTRAIKLCLTFVNSPPHFYGFKHEEKDKPEHWEDTRDEATKAYDQHKDAESPKLLIVKPYDIDEMRRRLIYYHGKKKKG